MRALQDFGGKGIINDLLWDLGGTDTLALVMDVLPLLMLIKDYWGKYLKKQTQFGLNLKQ